MSNTDLLEILEGSLYEITNLQQKIANKEEEGWEGSARRTVLKNRIKWAIKQTLPEKKILLSDITEAQRQSLLMKCLDIKNTLDDIK